jgi:hypothetical protein
VSHLSREIIEEKKPINLEVKIELDKSIIEIQQHSLVSDSQLPEEKQDAKPFNPTVKPTYIPAMLGGVMGIGIGWLLGVCVSTLLAVPTLGLSLVVPAICAFIGGIIGFGLAYWASNSNNADQFSMIKKENAGNIELSTRHTRKKINTLFSREHSAVFPESICSSSRTISLQSR